MLIIRGGHIVDPASGTDGIGDICIENGKIADKYTECENADIIDAHGLYISPGLVDMHVHFRDPGFTYKEDIYTGAEAAAAGGVTTAVCMPNTRPVLDNEEGIKELLSRAENACVNVIPFAAVTEGQRGEKLTDFEALKKAGAIALSDDGIPIDSEHMMRNALICAKSTGMLISSHCEYSYMVKNYAVNDGRISRFLGIPGRPAEAEELMIARDIELARETGGRVHIAHVSTAKSVDIIRKGKAAGVCVTAETCPQYFSLTEEAVLQKGALARVNPPLRTENDRLAIIEGLSDGTIDCLVTDHAPHSVEEKSRGIEGSLSGMIGLETSFALAMSILHHDCKFTIRKIIELMSTNPSQLLGLSAGRLLVGDRADIVIYDPDEKWTVDLMKFNSKSKNSPFGGMTLTGKVKMTLAGGKVVYKA